MSGISIDNSDNTLTDYEIQCFRFAPISNANVERSFSKFNLILTDRRYSFTEENLKYNMIVNYNSINDISV